MANKRIAAITAAPCDITDILSGLADTGLELIPPDKLLEHDLNQFDAFLILGGTQDQPLQFPAFERIKIEEQIGLGKKVYCEYCASISAVYFLGPTSTRFMRLIYAGNDLPADGIEPNDMLEDQCNAYLPPFIVNDAARPILLYKQAVKEHRQARITKKDMNDKSKWAMWFELDNLLLCMFRLSNFNKARMSPLDKWRSLVTAILQWVCGSEGVSGAVNSLARPYSRAGWDTVESFDKQVAGSIGRAVGWFENADMLSENGARGVEEGLSTEILPDGEQRRLRTIRDDCTGETSFMYFLHHMLTGTNSSLERADSLISFCFTAMQIKDGPHKGMMRWTESAWETCYQDDAARVILPWLLRSLYTGDRTYLDECTDALQFLVDTTGTDGTRIMRTDNVWLKGDAAEKLASVPGNLPSAHYNAFYLAALLLCYKLTGNETFKTVGIKGLGTIMSVYPDTAREQSETEELCRLIMPLAFACWVTGEAEHMRWLYRVAGDLQRFKHPSGGYLEWDTGYKANCSHNKGGESSLLAKNGDPVVDMLYSLNWLPVGFMQAYFVTGDETFLDLWKEIAIFFKSVQVTSANRLIDGAWTRGFDVELMEVYGTPNDIGWGPWAVESGWTMAEIASGLMMGLLREKLSACYKKL